MLRGQFICEKLARWTIGGSNGLYPGVASVASKPGSNYGTATTAHRTLGLTPAGTICRSNLSLGHYPIGSFTQMDSDANTCFPMMYAPAD